MRDDKGSLYEGGIRVPAVMVWPGVLPEGGEVGEVLHVVDWYPTLLSLAGASLEQEHPLDGKDAWQTIAHSAPTPHRELLLNINAHQAAIRRGNWKLVVDRSKETETVELFDVVADPSEKESLAEKHPDRVTELLERLEYYGQQATPPKDSREKPSDFSAPEVWGPSE